MINRFRTIFTIIFSVAVIGTFLTVSLPQASAAGGGFDPTFSFDGRDFLSGMTDDDRVRDMAIQADGRIVVVGRSFDGAHFLMARYNNDGTLDNSFGTFGKVIWLVNSAAGSGGANAVAIQPDGKIVVCGDYFDNAANDPIAIGRFNSNGSIDATFGSGGIAFKPYGVSATCGDIAIQSDGKLVIAGRGGPAGLTDWIVTRCNANGSADASFDGDGTAVTDFGFNHEGASAVAILADGRILAAGTTNLQSFASDFALVSYNTNGSLDTAFDGDGKAIVDFGPSDKANAMKVQPDGKIVVAGSTGGGFAENFALVRFNSNGSPDTSFDGDGKVVNNTNTAGTDLIDEIAFQPDGKIVTAGTFDTDLGVARYNSNGTLDTGFALGGVLRRRLADGPFSGTNEGTAIAIQTDGRIVVGASARVGSDWRFGVARLRPDIGGGRFDYDGDGKTDVSVFRPGTGVWYLDRSTDGFVGIRWGFGTDKITPADYDGDGKTDIGVFRPSQGTWYIFRSVNSTAYQLPWGLATDIPAPGDYDADGLADLAIFRPSNGTWWLNRTTLGASVQPFGLNGDKPVVGDYDRDGKADIAIYRPGVGQWWIQRSSDGIATGFQFGTSTDRPVQGDYTGDGKADIAIWRPSNGFWYVLRSEDFLLYGFPWGLSTDVPAPGDFDGDGKMDASVFRPSDTNWYINRSTAGLFVQQFGIATDVPVPSAYVP